MSQVAHSITHPLSTSTSTSPPDPSNHLNHLNHHHINKLNSLRDIPSNALNLHHHVHHLKPTHTKSFSLDPSSSNNNNNINNNNTTTNTAKPSHNSNPTIPINSPHPPPSVPSPHHASISSFHFPLLNLSSPTPPPIDKHDYFDQFPSSLPSKPARPLHQKAQSETSMRLELPRSLPSTHLAHIPMLRKKSGEVVRSSLKLVASSPRGCTTPTYASTRSAPSTPLSGPKAVHFDSHLEHVRHFLSQQRPMAVSRDGSPIETETEGEEEYPFPDMGRPADPSRWNSPPRTKLVIELLNMPLGETPPKVVCLKTIELRPDAKNLLGTVQVENLGFEKRVAVRFTFDKWQTVSEVTADYLSSGRPASKLDDRDSVDLFAFTIKLQDVLARIQEREMEIAVRYQAAGGEFWDNNSGLNYHVKFKHLRMNHHVPNAQLQQQTPTRQVHPSQTLASHKLPPSLTTQPSGNPSCPWAVTLRAELDRLVGDDLGLSMAAGGVIKKKLSNPTSGSPDLDGLTAMTRTKCGTGLSARYDFSSSLKQATCHSKQQPTRSSRFELSVPFPVSPVPIEWLGVVPIHSDGSTRRNSTNSFSPALQPCPPKDPSPRDPAVHHGSSTKRWTLPGMAHLPHLPPSPPQDSPPTMTHTDPISLPSPPPEQRQQQQQQLHADPSDEGVGRNPGSARPIGTPRPSVQDESSTKPQYDPPAGHPLRKQQPLPPLVSFVNFHRQCPSGLVSPQSPSLTDGSV